MEHFEIDIENDKTVVHPTCVCEKCRKVLTKVKQFSKKKSNNVISYQPQLIFFDLRCILTYAVYVNALIRSKKEEGL